jgi:hypothetical protein
MPVNFITNCCSPIRDKNNVTPELSYTLRMWSVDVSGLTFRINSRLSGYIKICKDSRITEINNHSLEKII